MAIALTLIAGCLIGFGLGYVVGRNDQDDPSAEGL